MKSFNTYNTFIYTALPCEAKPFIEYFKLKKDIDVHALAVYVNKNICLAVTGIGKSAMAAAIGYTHARYISTEHPVLLNIGIAGHQQYSLGELYLIDKITDIDSQKSYYPTLINTASFPRNSLQTVSKPQLQYHASDICDMEASAFYETAVRFTSSELIVCLKIISDNKDSSIDAIDAKQVSALISAKLSIIEPILIKTIALAALLTVPEPQIFNELLQRFHFTAHQRQQLKSQLIRWEVLTGQQPLLMDDTKWINGKEVLRWLKANIDAFNFSL